ncbi:hypothetical protein VNO78_25805 [Psophocarpus tetragonolobus]|uniref:Uncharacterized protein n=1 Tax=Psophocarpus tetragonolobus TaxID=3891 RepID=A0AAN9SAU0_PSOTE
MPAAIWASVRDAISDRAARQGRDHREEKIKHGPLNDHGGHKNNDVANLVNGDKQRDTLSQGTKDIIDAYWRVQSSTEDETTTDNSSLESHCSLGSVSEDEAEVKRPISYKLVPPPYVKEKMNKGESIESNQDIPEPVVRNKPISDSKIDSTESEKAKQHQHQQTKVEDEEERIMDGLLMHYNEDEEERIIDGLLMHYNEDEEERMMDGLLMHYKISLPPKDDTSMMETLRTHGRVTSLVPEMLRTARHVHPSLPDYDDLSARFAALKKATQPA